MLFLLRPCAVTFFAVTLLSMSGAAPLPNQPFAPAWHPASGNRPLLSYNLANDLDAPFNRGSVPLRSRFTNEALQVNPHAQPNRARVMALSAFTGDQGNPSQGSDLAHYYAFNNWQYIDSLVFWGGSSDGGSIVAPNGTIIDAAHRNGVPVYANVFMAPGVFGGQLSHVRDLVQKRPDGTFPVADKMIEVAQHNRFDGYFINQETEGGNAQLATDLRDFMRYMKSRSSLDIVWYDSMLESGPISWQNELNSQNDAFLQEPGKGLTSDEMFLNFDWDEGNRLTNSANRATSLGRNKYDVFAGIDVEGGGWNQARSNLNTLFPEGQPHAASLGIYRPDWTKNSVSTVEAAIERDSHFWVGANHDPSNTSGSIGIEGWKGIAHYIPAKSPVNGGPFVTNFNLGQGYNYFVNGRNLGPGEWNNLGLQDVMPTWRWVIDSSGAQLTPSFDMSDAYVGGSSLRVSGQLTEQNDLRLYMTRLPVTAETNFQLAFKTGVANQSSNMAILLAFEDSPTTFTAIPAGRSLTADWDLKSFDLSAYAGRTIAQIGLRFLDVNASNYNIKIGRLGVIEGMADIPAPPSNVSLQDSAQLDHQNASLRLLWEHSTDYSSDSQNEIYYYNVYHKDSHGVREFLGGTTNNAFYVSDLNRSPGEMSSLIEVIAVGTEFGESLAATFNFNWIAAGGDLNNDSHVNAADWLLFRPNQGGRFPGMTPVQTASLGDLDGDLDNDLDDFTLFIEDFEGAAGAGSFARMLAGVPEPQSAMLLAIGLAVAIRTRRQIPWRAASFATAVVASTITITGEADGQTYTLLRTPIAASSSSMGGPDNGIERLFDDATLAASHLGTRVYTSGSSQYAGSGLGPHNVFMEFRAPVLANTIAYAQRVGGDDRADKVGQIEFWFRDQSFGGILPIGPADATVPITNVENGTIMPYSMRGEYTGRFVAMRLTAHSTFGSIGGNEFRFVQGATELTLEVNRTTGSARIRNHGALAQVVGLKSYEIQSPAASMVHANWTTLGQQGLVGFPTGNGTGNGWEAGGLANDSLLIESYLTGASAIGLNQSLPLGRIYDAVQSAADLRFRYVLADGVPRTGFVRYTDELPGDFDVDGDVDGGDFLRWQRNVGAIGAPGVSQGNADGDSDVDAADLAMWRNHFGFVHAPSNASAATPEPTSTALAITALTTFLISRRQAAVCAGRRILRRCR